MSADEEKTLHEEEHPSGASDSEPTAIIGSGGEEKAEGAPSPKREDDWITAQVPQAPKTAPPSPPPATAQGEWSGAPSAAPPVEGKRPEPPPAAPKIATAAEAPAAGVSEGGIWGFLSDLGIKDRKTQQWVLYGGGGLILLCCACSCLGLLIVLLSGAFGS